MRVRVRYKGERDTEGGVADLIVERRGDVAQHAMVVDVERRGQVSGEGPSGRVGGAERAREERARPDVVGAPSSRLA